VNEGIIIGIAAFNLEISIGNLIVYPFHIGICPTFMINKIYTVKME
jgi:hypothetical protein